MPFIEGFVKRSVEMLLSIKAEGVIDARNVKSSYDGTTQTLKVEFTVSTYELAMLALQRYDVGETHEQVTQWLEQIAPSFREHLCEVYSEYGPRRWMVRPPIIAVSVLIAHEKIGT